MVEARGGRVGVVGVRGGRVGVGRRGVGLGGMEVSFTGTSHILWLVSHVGQPSSQWIFSV